MGDVKRALWVAEDAWLTTPLREGARVNARDGNQSTALHHACASAHKYMPIVVDVLLKSGAKVNAQDKNGITPLHSACISLNRSVVVTLLEAGAKVNAQDENGIAPLHSACITFNRSVVVTLLEAGAKVNAQDKGGTTPLHVACINTYQLCNLRLKGSIVDTLLRYGADKNLPDFLGITPLHCVADSAVTADAVYLINVLLGNSTAEGSEDRPSQDWADHPEDDSTVCLLNKKDYRGNTALHLASAKNNKEVVCSLLSIGAKVGVTNCSGKTALHLAVAARSKEVVNVLLDSGEDINATDRYGNSPLHIASMTDKEIVCMLLSKGATVGVKNGAGKTPLHIAAGNMFMSSEEIARDFIGFMVDNGEYVNSQDYLGHTILHSAISGKNPAVVPVLLLLGAKVELVDCDGRTALHVASSTNCRENFVYDLVEYGANVSAKDFEGNTPLHLCKFYTIKYKELVNFLITKGAKVDEYNIRMKTPYEKLANRCSEYGLAGQEKNEELFIAQVIRLKALGIQEIFNIKWRLGPDFYDKIRKRCCQELEEMKSTKVVKHVSLYEVLSHINQSFLLSNDDLERIDEFLSSPDLLTRFPLYGDTLRITFQRAKLLTLAVQSFYSERRKQMVKKLPSLVAEQLLTFLSIEDLRRFINSE